MDYQKRHIRIVHEGVAPTLLFVLLFIYYILVRLGQLQSECNFCDVILVCDDEQIKTNKFVFSSCSPVLQNIQNILNKEF